MGVSLAVSSEDVAWAIILVLCVVMMVAPFIFWAIVMITRRNQPPGPDPSGLTVDAGDAR